MTPTIAPSRASWTNSSTMCASELSAARNDSTSISVRKIAKGSLVPTRLPASRRRGDAGVSLAMHQQEHGGGVGGRDHRADQRGFGPVQIEHVFGDGCGDQQAGSGARRPSPAPSRAPAPRRYFETGSSVRRRTGSAPAPAIRQIGVAEVVELQPSGAEIAGQDADQQEHQQQRRPEAQRQRARQMPAITRIAPRNTAMLTESSEAISSHKSLQILGFASLSLPHLDANPFSHAGGKVPGFSGLIHVWPTCSYRWHRVPRHMEFWPTSNHSR